MSSLACVPPLKWNAKAWTSPSTRSAPTTCEFSRGAISRGRAQNYGSGTYPAMPGPLRGSSASWSPFFLRRRLSGAAEGERPGQGEAKRDCQSKPAGGEMAGDKTGENVMKLEGGCYCGQVRYVAEGEPMMKAQCHCRECQYITGGAPNMFV